MTNKQERNADAGNEPADATAVKGDVQKQIDEEQAQGFLGAKVDPRDNSEYSLESGPDAPAHVADDRTRLDQPSRKES